MDCGHGPPSAVCLRFATRHWPQNRREEAEARNQPLLLPPVPARTRRTRAVRRGAPPHASLLGVALGVMFTFLTPELVVGS
jgi:hypothetical protein